MGKSSLIYNEESPQFGFASAVVYLLLVLITIWGWRWLSRKHKSDADKERKNISDNTRNKLRGRSNAHNKSIDVRFDPYRSNALIRRENEQD